MPLRRSHAKSHHGCAHCKQRRIKCDEARPACGSCVRKNLPCSFHGTAPEPPRSPTADAALLPGCDSALPMQELELLHEWHTVTAVSLAADKTQQNILRVEMPREALSSPFLMHSILAVAALHKAQTLSGVDRVRYSDTAMKHHNKSLSLCSPLLKNITPANCHALFAFSSLVPVFRAAVHVTGASRAYNIAGVVESFRLIRGTASVVDRAKPWIAEGPFHPLLRVGHFRQQLAEEDTQRGLNLLEGIRSMIYNLPVVRLDSIVHAAAGTLLHLLQVYLDTGDERAIMAWPVLVEPLFFDLLLEQNRAALLVLASLGCVWGIVPPHWWFEGWAAFLVELSRSCLSLEDQEIIHSMNVL
ncbi:C6 zinc finger domain protein [Aspergillus californicus]